MNTEFALVISLITFILTAAIALVGMLAHKSDDNRLGAWLAITLGAIGCLIVIVFVEKVAPEVLPMTLLGAVGSAMLGVGTAMGVHATDHLVRRALR